MSDVLTSIVRDVTGKVVGGIVGLALTAGVTIPAEMSAQLTVAVGGVITLVCQIVYYVAVRAAEQHWPTVGRLLGTARSPAYGLDLPVHARLVVDHEATEAEAARILQAVRKMTDDEMRHARPR